MSSICFLTFRSFPISQTISPNLLKTTFLDRKATKKSFGHLLLTAFVVLCVCFLFSSVCFCLIKGIQIQCLTLWFTGPKTFNENSYVALAFVVESFLQFLAVCFINQNETNYQFAFLFSYFSLLAKTAAIKFLSSYQYDFLFHSYLLSHYAAKQRNVMCPCKYALLSACLFFGYR